MDDGIATQMRSAADAYLRFAERAADADRGRATRLAGWTVGDLVDHVAWGAAMEATATAVAAGATMDPGGGTLGEAVAAFGRAARLEVDPATPVALTAGTVPMGYAAPLFVFEAALHAGDLAHALDGVEPRLDAGELAACAVVIGPMLDLVAAAAPEDDVVIDLVGLGDGIRLRSVDGAWQRSVPDEGPVTTRVAGSPHDLVLFACGRVGACELQVTGAAEHAERFKTYFPGP